MANISSADGTVSVDEKWDPELIGTLNMIFEKASAWEYGIHLQNEIPCEDASGRRSAAFYASGRWSFNSNLNSLGGWLEGDMARKNMKTGNPVWTESEKEAYAGLLRAMAEKWLIVEFSFEDVEEGCGVYYKEKGFLKVVGEGSLYQLHYEEAFHESIEGVWDELIGKMEPFKDSFNELASLIIENTAFRESDRALIEGWVKEKTHPDMDADWLYESITEAYGAGLEAAIRSME